MASRKQAIQTVVAPEVADVTIERHVEFIRGIRKLLMPTAVTSQADESIKRGVAETLARIESDINASVDRLVDDGLTLDEINDFACLQIALLPEVERTGGRVKFSWKYKVVLPE